MPHMMQSIASPLSLPPEAEVHLIIAYGLISYIALASLTLIAIALVSPHRARRLSQAEATEEQFYDHEQDVYFKLSPHSADQSNLIHKTWPSFRQIEQLERESWRRELKQHERAIAKRLVGLVEWPGRLDFEYPQLNSPQRNLLHTLTEEREERSMTTQGSDVVLFANGRRGCGRAINALTNSANRVRSADQDIFTISPPAPSNTHRPGTEIFTTFPRAHEDSSLTTRLPKNSRQNFKVSRLQAVQYGFGKYGYRFYKDDHAYRMEDELENLRPEDVDDLVGETTEIGSLSVRAIS